MDKLNFSISEANRRSLQIYILTEILAGQRAHANLLIELSDKNTEEKEKLLNSYNVTVKKFSEEIFTDIYILMSEIFTEGLNDENAVSLKRVVIESLAKCKN